MICPGCRYENLEGANYCNQCGSPLLTTVRADFPPQSFDEKLAKLQRYLPEGLTRKILSQRDRIEGERRHVTVMFCDMEGFTPLVDRLGAEKAYTVMGKIYEILIRQVHDYEGTINEMTGDGIMALFGAPIALEEAPQRALWAAHAIHREIAVFNQHQKDFGPIRMRIGIHSGPVVVGTLGNDLRVEFKAVGDTVNLASRMEHLADPGTTYVTRDIFKQARGMFEFENLGKKVIKGKGESISVYKVLPDRKGVHRPRLGSERMIFSDMVGRSSKLDQLELQVLKLINGNGSIVNVIGEAGIGKSRLIAELKQRESLRRVTVLEGRAVSMGRNLSFHPISDFLKHWAGIRVDDDAIEAFSKQKAALQRLFPDKSGDVLPFVATLLGMNLPEEHRDRIRGIEGDALEKLIRKNVREVLIRLSKLGPLIVIIDDLHWADKSSIALLEFLFRLAKRERILFINLFRPGYAETGHRILSVLENGHSVYQRDIVLEPLDERMSEALIVDMLDLKGINHAVVGQIVQRAGGNPYFIEEVVRSFIDEGAVVIRGGKFQVTDKFGTMTIPNTINDVLMARIDRLEENARDLLKVAAVIGRNFFYRILSEVSDSTRDMDDRLSYLKDMQFILERERFEELEYHFKHALTQEAAYASILPDKCKALHLKVAHTIEKVFAEKLHAFYGMLAYHYSRGENLEKAEDALIKAGEEALKTSASSEALHYYLEALNLYRRKSGQTADSAKVALLEKNIAVAFHNRGQYEEALEYFDKSLKFYWGKFPKHPVSRFFHMTYGFFHLLAALYLPFMKFKKVPTAKDREAIELFYTKCQTLIIIYPRRFFFESLYFYRRFTQFDFTRFPNGAGKFISASALFTFTGISFGLGRRILALAQGRLNRQDERQMITYDLLQSTLKYFAGDWPGIERHDDDLVNRNLDIGEIWSASLHYYWHGFHNLYQGDIAITQWLVKRLNDIAEVYENDATLLFKQLLNTCLLMESRLLPEALDEIDRGVALAKKTNSGLSLIHLYGCRAQIYLLMEDRKAAAASLEKADVIRRSQEIVPWMVSVFCRSRAALALNRLQAAITDGHGAEVPRLRRQAHKCCRALLRQTRKVAQHRTEALCMMGVYCWLIRKRRPALKWWQKSIRVGEHMGARIALSRTYAEVGLRLAAAESPQTLMGGMPSSAYLEKAGALFEEMNLEWDLRRLQRMSRPKGA
jgi:class 3 adenylate cyclase/tetratricopeptide (TPR) repeat protein